MVHGRGGSARDILGLAGELGLDDVLYVAPQAAGNTWYPYSFLSPIAQNEPWLGSALKHLGRMVDDLGGEGLPAERVALLGFSQGACLSLEFAARHPRRYRAIVGFSGGLIGPPGSPRDYQGGFEGTPVFLGCSDVDPHIPVERVHETADVLGRMRAAVDERIYPGLPHTINEDEIAAARALLAP
jgi:predicted esterase